MLEKLFESLDDKVFTAELKESLQNEFNEAVEQKAEEIAADKINESLEDLNEKSEEHIEFLNEKAEEYVEQKQQEMLEQVNKYLELVVDEFLNEKAEEIQSNVNESKADMIIDGFESMLVATGVKVKQISEAVEAESHDSILSKQKEKLNKVINENIELKETNQNLLKTGLIKELSENLTIIEAQKFKKLAEMVEFSQDEGYLEKLNVIKESIKSKTDDVEQDESNNLNESNNSSKSVYSHLV